jgi:hypothetical protein
MNGSLQSIAGFSFIALGSAAAKSAAGAIE